MQKIGNANRFVNFVDLREPDGRIIGFGRRGEKRTEANVIRAFALGSVAWSRLWVDLPINNGPLRPARERLQSNRSS